MFPPERPKQVMSGIVEATVTQTRLTEINENRIQPLYFNIFFMRT